MTQPISGYVLNAYDFVQDERSRVGLNFCRDARTVTEGFLCDEPSVVSNACRTPSNRVDAHVCDDRQLAGLQRSVWDTTKDALRTIFGALVGGKR